MPGDIRAHDVPPINETAALIVGKDARLVQDGARGVLMEICTASDKPTSRLQAELLVNWYEAQKSKLITRGSACSLPDSSCLSWHVDAPQAASSTSLMMHGFRHGHDTQKQALLLALGLIGRQ